MLIALIIGISSGCTSVIHVLPEIEVPPLSAVKPVRPILEEAGEKNEEIPSFIIRNLAALIRYSFEMEDYAQALETYYEEVSIIIKERT